MATKKTVEEVTEVEPTFDKEQLIKSKKYQESADLIGAILLPEKGYTLKEVDSLIEKFKKKEIKTC